MNNKNTPSAGEGKSFAANSSVRPSSAVQIPKAEMQKLIDELDCLQEETDRSSFGIPPTRGEIKHYEDNKERILEIIHELMPHIRTLEAEHKRMREALERMIKQSEKMKEDDEMTHDPECTMCAETEKAKEVLSSITIHD